MLPEIEGGVPWKSVGKSSTKKGMVSRARPTDPREVMHTQAAKCELIWH